DYHCMIWHNNAWVF
nr:immunoglobulin light chain junction region [Macaca mulatta]MOY08697.1 immunoglobulin light chain junction region [Macaca mulatta]